MKNSSYEAVRIQIKALSEKYENLSRYKWSDDWICTRKKENGVFRNELSIREEALRKKLAAKIKGRIKNGFIAYVLARLFQAFAIEGKPHRLQERI